MLDLDLSQSEADHAMMAPLHEPPKRRASILDETLTALSIKLEVIQGDGLVAKDRNVLGQWTTSDPYVMVSCFPMGLKGPEIKLGKSHTIRFTLSPKWEEEFAIELPLMSVTDDLQFRVTIMDWDEDLLAGMVQSDDDLMGIVAVKVPSTMYTGQGSLPITKWYGVPATSASRASGRIQCTLEVCKSDKKRDDIARTVVKEPKGGPILTQAQGRKPKKDGSKKSLFKSNPKKDSKHKRTSLFGLPRSGSKMNVNSNNISTSSSQPDLCLLRVTSMSQSSRNLNSQSCSNMNDAVLNRTSSSSRNLGASQTSLGNSIRDLTVEGSSANYDDEAYQKAALDHILMKRNLQRNSSRRSLASTASTAEDSEQGGSATSQEGEEVVEPPSAGAGDIYAQAMNSATPTRRGRPHPSRAMSRRSLLTRSSSVRGSSTRSSTSNDDDASSSSPSLHGSSEDFPLLSQRAKNSQCPSTRDIFSESSRRGLLRRSSRSQSMRNIQDVNPGRARASGKDEENSGPPITGSGSLGNGSGHNRRGGLQRRMSSRGQSMRNLKDSSTFRASDKGKDKSGPPITGSGAFDNGSGHNRRGGLQRRMSSRGQSSRNINDVTHGSSGKDQVNSGPSITGSSALDNHGSGRSRREGLGRSMSQSPRSQSMRNLKYSSPHKSGGRDKDKGDPPITGSAVQRMGGLLGARDAQSMRNICGSGNNLATPKTPKSRTTPPVKLSSSNSGSFKRLSMQKGPEMDAAPTAAARTISPLPDKKTRQPPKKPMKVQSMGNPYVEGGEAEQATAPAIRKAPTSIVEVSESPVPRSSVGCADGPPKPLLLEPPLEPSNLIASVRVPRPNPYLEPEHFKAHVEVQSIGNPNVDREGAPKAPAQTIKEPAPIVEQSWSSASPSSVDCEGAESSLEHKPNEQSSSAVEQSLSSTKEFLEGNSSLERGSNNSLGESEDEDPPTIEDEKTPLINPTSGATPGLGSNDETDLNEADPSEQEKLPHKVEVPEEDARPLCSTTSTEDSRSNHSSDRGNGSTSSVGNPSNEGRSKGSLERSLGEDTLRSSNHNRDRRSGDLGGDNNQSNMKRIESSSSLYDSSSNFVREGDRQEDCKASHDCEGGRSKSGLNANAERPTTTTVSDSEGQDPRDSSEKKKSSESDNGDSAHTKSGPRSVDAHNANAPGFYVNAGGKEFYLSRVGKQFYKDPVTGGYYADGFGATGRQDNDFGFYVDGEGREYFLDEKGGEHYKEDDRGGGNVGFFIDGGGREYYLDEFGIEHFKEDNMQPDPDSEVPETGFFLDEDGHEYYLDSKGVEYYKNLTDGEFYTHAYQQCAPGQKLRTKDLPFKDKKEWEARQQSKQ